MVRVDQDGVPALVPGEVLRGFQQLPAHAAALELGQDVEGEFGQVEVVRERQGNVHGSDDLAVDLGHQDHLAFVGVRHFQQLLQRGVGEVVAPPGLHPDLAAHFDGGKEVRCIRSVQRIRDPELLDPYLVCHSGHVPSHSAAHLTCAGPAPGISWRQHMPVCGVPRAGRDGAYRRRPLLPFPVPARRTESEGDVDGEHVVVFGAALKVVTRSGRAG